MTNLRKTVAYEVINIISKAKAVLVIDFLEGIDQKRIEARLYDFLGQSITSREAKRYLPLGFLNESEYELESDAVFVASSSSPAFKRFINLWINSRIPLWLDDDSEKDAEALQIWNCYKEKMKTSAKERRQ